MSRAARALLLLLTRDVSSFFSQLSKGRTQKAKSWQDCWERVTGSSSRQGCRPPQNCEMTRRDMVEMEHKSVQKAQGTENVGKENSGLALSRSCVQPCYIPIPFIFSVPSAASLSPYDLNCCAAFCALLHGSLNSTCIPSSSVMYFPSLSV